MTNEIFSLVDVENKFIAYDPGLKRYRPGLHPSEASVRFLNQYNDWTTEGTCLRQAYILGMGIGKRGDTDVNLQMKADLGKAAEQMLVNRWKEMGIWVGNNIKFYNKKYSLSGELDAVVKDPDTDRLIGVEVKSFYGFMSNKLICGSKRPRKPEKPTPGQPRTHQYLQAAVYAWEYRNELDEYRIYYIERGDGHRIDFKVGFEKNEDGTHQCYWEQIPGQYWSNYEPGRKLQPYTIEDIYNRYEQLLMYYKKNEMPPKDYEYKWSRDKIELEYSRGNIAKTTYEKNKKGNQIIGDWSCSYCPIRDECDKHSL